MISYWSTKTKMGKRF